ncbi:MAG TPA: TRASH domain-containing protein [Gemmataceae bacterium]|nr:TRASH domain-containing protein [Gemmataceae bacterium]
MNRLVVAIVAMGLFAGMSLVGCTSAKQPAVPPGAVDMHNTVCPVSGDKVGDSKYIGVYDNKVYHLCCDDCPKDFQKDPQKYANAVAADPVKYGVRQ